MGVTLIQKSDSKFFFSTSYIQHSNANSAKMYLSHHLWGVIINSWGYTQAQIHIHKLTLQGNSGSQPNLPQEHCGI